MNSDDKALTLKQVEKRSGLSKLKRYIENLIDKRIINEITGYELPTKERIQKIVSPGKEIEDAASILKEHNLRSPKYTEAIKLVRESGSTEFQGISEMTGITLSQISVSYTHLRAHETVLDLVCRLLLEKKKNLPPHRIPPVHSQQYMT